LDDVLTRLSDYLERSQELKDTVSTALIYPAILLVMSLASLFVMLTFVVPQFTEMFESAAKPCQYQPRLLWDWRNGCKLLVGITGRYCFYH